LNSSINYRVFSDVAALTGSPNGLIQNEFDLDLLLDTQIVKRKKKIEPKAKNFILAHRVSIFLETSKFDSQFDTAKTEEITKDLARSLLIERSKYSFGAAINVFQFGYTHTFQLNAGYRNFNSDVQETKTDTARVLRIHQHSIYPEVKVRIRLSDRLYADMIGRYLFHNMNVEFLDPDVFWKQFFNAEIMVNAILD